MVESGQLCTLAPLFTSVNRSTEVFTAVISQPVGSSVNSVFFEEIRKFRLGFMMVTCDQLYLEVHINNQYMFFSKRIQHNYIWVRECQATFEFFPV